MSNNEPLSSLTIAVRLTIICFVAVTLLIAANALTINKILENSKIEEDKANKFLFSNAAKFSEKMIFNSLDDKDKKNFYYFKALDNNNNIIGYIVYTQGTGFGGTMKIGFLVNIELKILKVKLMDNSETPGYGKKYEKEKNIKLFFGTNTAENPIPDNLISLTQDEKDTVTSATISFKGIADGLINGANLVKKEIK